MRSKGIATLVAVLFFCLPNLAGGTALLYNYLLGRPIDQWDKFSSLSVATAVVLGTPLLIVAMLICALAVFKLNIPQRLRFADVSIVALAVVGSMLISIGFHV
jgi:hypothetical protein